MVKRTKRTTSRTTTKATSSRLTNERQPLVAHLQELKRRVVYVALTITVLSAVVYGFETRLIDILLRPSHGQKFVYTSPMGGMNFLFSVCVYFGIALSVPVIVYHILQFLRPLMRDTAQRFIVVSSVVSGFLAVCGILFGYFIGLPAALHFLLKQQFHSGQVEALISIQSYFSFVVAYMFSAALMLQLPLLLVVVNRIKPLSPGRMLRYERGVIAFSFIGAFIMNPTPNVVDQLLTVVPVLVSYQLGIVIVWLINKRSVTHRYSHLFSQDSAVRQARLQKIRQATPLPSDALEQTPWTAPAPAQAYTREGTSRRHDAIRAQGVSTGSLRPLQPVAAAGLSQPQASRQPELTQQVRTHRPGQYAQGALSGRPLVM